MFDQNKKYRLANGWEWELVSIDNDPDYPVNGRYYSPVTDEWTTNVWTFDLKFPTALGECGYDLVEVVDETNAVTEQEIEYINTFVINWWTDHDQGVVPLLITEDMKENVELILEPFKLGSVQ